VSIREVESEGPEEKCRAAIDGDHPQDERSAKGGASRVCTSGTKAFSFTHRTKVFAGSAARKNNA